MKRKILLCICFLSTIDYGLWTSFLYAGSLNRAEALYLQGSYSESIDECATSIARNKDLDKAYYLLGLNYLKINDTEKAREKLKILIGNYSSSKYIDNAQLLYADSYFVEQDYAGAGALYEGILKNNPLLASSAYLGLARCALKTGDWGKAKGYAEALQQKFPKSLEAVAAKELFARDEFFFTVQVGCFASTKNAQRLVQKLKDKQFDGYIDELPSPQNILYRVRVGKLKTRQEAETLKNALEQNGYPTKIFP